MNQSQSELVRTGLVTAKNRKRPVHIGPVRFFGSLGISRTGLGLGPRLLRLKTETGPDFQSLAAAIACWLLCIAVEGPYVVHSSAFKVIRPVLAFGFHNHSTKFVTEPS